MAKFVVFFLVLELSLPSFGYLILIDSFAFDSLGFLSSLPLRFTRSLMTPSSLTYLKLALDVMTGLGVLTPYLERLLEAWCLMRILSEEWGVRGAELSRCMPAPPEFNYLI